MTVVDWRALIEAYLDGRLSADAFARRFSEAWIAQANDRFRPPQAVTDLFAAVEQYADAGPADGNDDDMRQSATRALAQLASEPPVAQHTFDRTRAREEMRRFQIHMRGCAGAGCLLAVIWIALCVLQINFVIEWIHANLIDNVWLSAVLGFFLAFAPVVGNLLAFLGASAAGWPAWLAAIVFFAAPAGTLLSGWARWRRHRPPRG